MISLGLLKTKCQMSPSGHNFGWTSSLLVLGNSSCFLGTSISIIIMLTALSFSQRVGKDFSADLNNPRLVMTM